MYKESVGLVGGFGAYATLDFYKQILEAFASDCERNYPHIYMDNDFTMPSRTRALLYGEEYDQVVNMIAASLKKLINLGADHIILICGTAHAFLPDVYKIVPEAEGKVISLLDTIKEYIDNNHYESTLIIAAEGTLDKKVYESRLEDESKSCIYINPGEENYTEIRYFIEAVKQNKFTKETAERWASFLYKFPTKNVILGCTEFPSLVSKCSEYEDEFSFFDYNFINPLELVIEKLKSIIK